MPTKYGSKVAIAIVRQSNGRATAEQHWLAAEQEVLSAQLSAAVPSTPAKAGQGPRQHLNDPRDEFLGALECGEVALQAAVEDARGLLFLLNGT